MPVGGLLVGMGGAQHRLLVVGAARQLEADGQAIVGEAAGHGDGGEAVDIEGPGELGKGRGRAHGGVAYLDSSIPDAVGSDRLGGSYQDVYLIEQVPALPIEDSSGLLGLDVVGAGYEESGLYAQAHRWSDLSGAGADPLPVIGRNLALYDGV